MCIHNSLCDGKSQTCAASAAVAGLLAAIEAFEDMWDILDRDPFAGIAHGNIHALSRPPRMDSDLTPGSRVPQRVADQVVEDTSNSLGIHEDRIHVLFHLSFELDTLAIGEFGKTFERVGDQIA